jgi:hypothetical protein
MNEQPPLNDEDSKECLEVGQAVYKMMKQKYPKCNMQSLDIIMNSLCCTLICLRNENVRSENYKKWNRMILNILDENNG